MSSFCGNAMRSKMKNGKLIWWIKLVLKHYTCTCTYQTILLYREKFLFWVNQDFKVLA